MKKHHQWLIAGLLAGALLCLGVSALVGRAAWSNDPYCRGIAGASSATLVQAGSAAGTQPLQQPAKTTVVCKTR